MLSRFTNKVKDLNAAYDKNQADLEMSYAVIKSVSKEAAKAKADVTWHKEVARRADSDRSILWNKYSGLCEKVACKGTLELRYFDQHRLIYTLDFDAAGKRYRFVGEKVNIWPWNLLTSHTTCFGRLIEQDSGKLVSTSVTYFHLVRAPEFAASFRLV